MTHERAEVLRLLSELSELAPELRLGQLIANLATRARGANVEAIWDAEDEELLPVLKQQVDFFRKRHAEMAATVN